MQSSELGLRYITIHVYYDMISLRCARDADEMTATDAFPPADDPAHILLTSSAVTSLKAWTGPADLVTSRVEVSGATTQLSLAVHC